MKYDVFISYKHTPLDMAVAQKLQRSLEHFRIPREVQKKTGKKKIERVFRDREELSIGQNLDMEIREQIQNSEYLVVICSPESKESPWVNHEIEMFRECHSARNILPLLVRGEPYEAFPPALVDSGEPFAADIRAESQAKTLRKLDGELLRILAPVLDCSYDELYQRQKRYRMQRIALFSSLALAVSVSFTAFSLYQYRKLTVAYRQQSIEESRVLVQQAADYLDEGDNRAAIEKLLQALPKEGEDRPVLPEAEYQLSRALGCYDTVDSLDSMRQVKRVIRCQDHSEDGAALDEDGCHILTYDSQGYYLWDTDTCSLVSTVPIKHGYAVQDAIRSNYLFPEHQGLVLTLDSVNRYDLLTGKRIWSRTEASGLRDLRVDHDRGLIYVVTERDLVVLGAEDGSVRVRHKLPIPSNYKAAHTYSMCLYDDGERVAVNLVLSKRAEDEAAEDRSFTGEDPVAEALMEQTAQVSCILLLDTGKGTWERVPAGGNGCLMETESGDLLCAWNSDSVSGEVLRLKGDTGEVRWKQTIAGAAEYHMEDCSTLEGWDNFLALMVGTHLSFLHQETGEIIDEMELEDTGILFLRSESGLYVETAHGMEYIFPSPDQYMTKTVYQCDLVGIQKRKGSDIFFVETEEGNVLEYADRVVDPNIREVGTLTDNYGTDYGEDNVIGEDWFVNLHSLNLTVMDLRDGLSVTAQIYEDGRTQALWVQNILGSRLQLLVVSKEADENGQMVERMELDLDRLKEAVQKEQAEKAASEEEKSQEDAALEYIFSKPFVVTEDMLSERKALLRHVITYSHICFRGDRFYAWDTTYGGHDCIYRVDLNTDEVQGIRLPIADAISQMLVSPDEKTILLTSSYGMAFYLVDAATGTLQDSISLEAWNGSIVSKVCSGNPYGSRYCCFSPDSRFLAYSNEKQICCYDRKTRNTVVIPYQGGSLSASRIPELCFREGDPDILYSVIQGRLMAIRVSDGRILGETTVGGSGNYTWQFKDDRLYLTCPESFSGLTLTVVALDPELFGRVASAGYVAAVDPEKGRLYQSWKDNIERHLKVVELYTLESMMTLAEDWILEEADATIQDKETVQMITTPGGVELAEDEILILLKTEENRTPEEAEEDRKILLERLERLAKGQYRWIPDVRASDAAWKDVSKAASGDASGEAGNETSGEASEAALGALILKKAVMGEVYPAYYMEYLLTTEMHLSVYTAVPDSLTWRNVTDLKPEMIVDLSFTEEMTEAIRAAQAGSMSCAEAEEDGEMAGEDRSTMDALGLGTPVRYIRLELTPSAAKILREAWREELDLILGQSCSYADYECQLDYKGFDLYPGVAPEDENAFYIRYDSASYVWDREEYQFYCWTSADLSRPFSYYIGQATAWQCMENQPEYTGRNQVNADLVAGGLELYYEYNGKLSMDVYQDMEKQVKANLDTLGIPYAFGRGDRYAMVLRLGTEASVTEAWMETVAKEEKIKLYYQDMVVTLDYGDFLDVDMEDSCYRVQLSSESRAALDQRMEAWKNRGKLTLMLGDLILATGDVSGAGEAGSGTIVLRELGYEDSMPWLPEYAAMHQEMDLSRPMTLQGWIQGELGCNDRTQLRQKAPEACDTGGIRSLVSGICPGGEIGIVGTQLYIKLHLDPEDPKFMEQYRRLSDEILTRLKPEDRIYDTIRITAIDTLWDERAWSVWRKVWDETTGKAGWERNDYFYNGRLKPYEDALTDWKSVLER